MAAEEDFVLSLLNLSTVHRNYRKGLAGDKDATAVRDGSSAATVKESCDVALKQ